ncbi:MAG: iron-containing alcohol dehydrogenase [Dehalococcoidia bacterium]|nr:iron-containing alcohol dehydrogenase [Dehalococcoidia bacterium]
MADNFVPSFVWRNTTRIVFGTDTLDQLPNEVRDVVGEGSKILLVTGRSFLRSRGILQRVLNLLDGFDVVLHDRADPFPTPADADEAAAVCRESGVDIVVGIGGGSALDLAKAAAVLATHEGPAKDYSKRIAKLENASLPFIAVPTTSGSSSEVTSGSALWDWDSHSQFGLGDVRMFPTVAIVDPKLAMTMSQSLVANTGMDAFTSAFESYWNVNSEPISDAYALEVMRLYSGNLVRSAIQGDLESRAACALAATMSGVGYSNSTPNACHGVGSPLTLYWRAEHGQSVSITLTSFLKWSAPAIADRIPALLSAVGVSTIEEASDKIERIMSDCGLETRLSGLGIQEDDIDKIVENTRWDRLALLPKPMERDDLRKMLTEIL